MPSAEPISAGTFGVLVGVDIFAGSVKDRFIAIRRGIVSGVAGDCAGAGEEAMLAGLLLMLIDEHKTILYQKMMFCGALASQAVVRTRPHSSSYSCSSTTIRNVIWLALWPSHLQPRAAGGAAGREERRETPEILLLEQAKNHNEISASHLLKRDNEIFDDSMHDRRI